MIPAGEIFLNGKKYISSKKASKLTGYTNDYVGQLCRGNKIESQMVGRARFVEEGSLLNYAKKPKGNEKSFFNKTEDNKNLKNVFEKTADLKNKILAPQYLIFGQKVVTMVLMFVVAFGGYKFSETPFAQASFEKISSSSDIVGRALYNFAGGTSEKISETGRKIVLGSQDISGRIILGTNSILDIAENNISGAINNFAEVQNNKKVAQLEGEEEGVSETLSVATKEISFGENKSVVTESFLSLISGGVTKFAQSVFSKVNSSSSFIKSGSENKVASLQKVYTESIGYIIVGTNSSVTSVGNSVIRLTINLSENIKLGVTSATNLVLGLTNKTKNQLSNFAIINKENKNEILVQKNKEETPALSKSKLLENQKLVKGLNSSIGFVNSSVKKTVEETFSFYKNYFDLVTKTSTKFAKAEIGYLQNIKSSNKKILGSINLVKNILVDSPKFAVRSFENFVSTYEGGLEGVVALNENIKDVSRDNTKVALKIQNTNFENPTKNINNDGEIFEKSFGVFTFAKNIKKQGNEFVQNIIGGVNFLSISFAKSIDSLAMTSKNKLTGLSDLTKNKSNDFTNNLALAARETEQISKTKVETFAHDFYQTVNGLFDKSGKTTVIVKEEEVKKELEEEPVQIVREIVQPIEQTTVVNPIRERTVETRVERVVSGVTLADLQALNNELRAEIYRVADNSTVQTSNNYRAIALTNKIDNLSSVTINNSTITGGTITGATFSGSTLNLSSSLSGSSGSFSGNLSSGGNITASGNITAGGNLLTSGQLTVSGTATSTMAGDFAFNSSTLYIDSINGRVGIGTTSPEDTLAINGVAYFAPISAPSNTADRLYNVSNDLYWAGNLIGGATSANWTLSGSDAYRLTGNVGIGTTSPTHKLSVEGTSSLGNQARAGYFTATTSTATSTFAGGLTVGIDKFVVDNSTGYVGIGTTSPEYALEINGSSQNGIYIANSDYSGSYTIISPGEEIIIDKSSLSLSGDPGFYTFQDGIQLLSFAWDDELVEGISLRVANDVGPQKISLREGVSIGENYKSYLPPIMGLIVEGNVGIGTTSPLAKLSVKGAGTTTGINFQTTNSNNTSLMTVLDNGYVGIGIDSPTEALDVNGNVNALGGLGVRRGFSIGSNEILQSSSGDTYLISPLEKNIYLRTDGTSAGVTRMTIQNTTGNIGIGTTSPFAKLSVVGDGYFTGGKVTASTLTATSSMSAPYFTATSATATSTFAGGLNVANGGLVYDYSTGNVGIGNIPSQKLTIESSSNASSPLLITESGGGTLFLIRELSGGDSEIRGYDTDGNLDVNLSTNGDSYLDGGNLGIGTTSPFAKLAVTNTGTGNSFLVEDSISPDSSPFVITSSGSIGIGTANPDTLLHIYTTSDTGLRIESVDEISRLILKDNVGQAFIEGRGSSIIMPSGNVGIGTTSPFAKLSVVGDGYFTGGTVTASTLTATSSMSAPYFTATSATATSTFAGGLNVANGGLVYDYSTGNVGVGTSSPSKSLHIKQAGASSDYGLLIDDGSGNTGQFYINSIGTLIGVASKGTTFTSLNGNASFRASSNINFQDETGLNTWMKIVENGNIGIGTTSPFAKLAVTNTGSEHSFLVEDSTSPDSTPFVIDASGNVGIGTASPTSKLQVVSSEGVTLTVKGDHANGLLVDFNSIQNRDVAFRMQGSSTWTVGMASSLNNSFVFSTENNYPSSSPDATKRLVITTSGNVGIGTTSPTQKLDVAGFINTDQYSGYKQAGNTILYASSTNFSLLAGQGAGASLLSDGLYNTALGYEALNTATSSNSNTSVGYQTGYSNTTGAFNSFIGTSAGYANTTGNFNSFVGVNAGLSNTTGSWNSFIGLNAGFSNTTGDSNSFFGTNAGRYIANGSTANETTSDSVFLGYNTKALANSQSNQIVIGYEATGLGSNSVVLGNDSILTTALKGNVGIGTNSPDDKFTVYENLTANAALNVRNVHATGIGMILSGGGSGGGYIADFRDYTNVSKVRFDGNGNVGIGTTSPQSKLHISQTQGDIEFKDLSGININSDVGLVFDGNGSLESALFTEVDGKILSYGINVQQLTSRDSSRPGGIFRLDTRSTGKFSILGIPIGGSEREIFTVELSAPLSSLVVSTSGNIGIGTTSPFAKLSVVGDGYFTGGTVTASTLTATSSISAPYLTATSATATSTFAGGLTVGTNKFTVDNSTGYVGIGTDSPTRKLDVSITGSNVVATFRAGGSALLDIDGGEVGDSGLRFKSSVNWVAGVDYSDNNSFIIEEGTGFPGEGTNRFYIQQGTGNIGIGTTSPQAKLHVGSASSTLISYSNLSDSVFVSGDLEVVGNTYLGAQEFETNAGVVSWTDMPVTSSASIGTVESYSAMIDNTSLLTVYAQSNGAGGIQNSAIGIGTTSPLARLSVQALSGSPALNIASSTGASMLYVSGSGNVGIGTDSPDKWLTINRTDSTDDHKAIQFQKDGVYQASIGWNTLHGRLELGTNGNNQPIRFNGSAMMIAGTGNVGIGTTSPSAKLDIYGGNLNLDNTTNANQYGIISKNGTPFIHNFNYGNNGTVTTNGYNTFVGVNSGNLTMGSTAAETWEGSDNTAVGSYSLISNTTGFDNTAVGVAALYANTTGALNTANGGYSLYNNTTGGSNTASGYNSLRLNTTGSSNTATGLYALYANTTGSNNTSVGLHSMYFNKTGSDNTALGYQANIYNISATSTVAIGYQAGRGVFDESYNQNGVLLGYKAGYGLTTGDNNLLLGYQAGDNLTTGDSNIVIGYNIDSPTATNSNTMTIGNLIYGTGIDGTGTTVSNGKIGIGTTTPISTLSVQGSLCVRDTGSCGTTAGTIYATTASIADIDLAENYPTQDETLTAGEIVSLDLNNKENIKRAEKGENTIGIISTAPGLLLGQEVEKGKPVALSGRVPVKVNLEGGDINIGDRITLSNTPGVGMKASTTSRTVGVALEVFNSQSQTSTSTPSTGSIVVFVENELTITTNIETLANKVKELELRIADLEAKSTEITGSVSIQAVMDYMEGLGVKMMANVVEFKDVIAEKLTADKVVTNGIEMKDEVTGDIYCVKIKNGVMVNIPGECQLTDSSEPTSENIEEPTISIQGNNPAQIELNSTYIDMGVIAQDSEGNDLSIKASVFTNDDIIIQEEISVASISLDTSTSTTYTITYTTTDNNGTTVSAEREVIVGEVDSSEPTADSEEETTPEITDTEAPIITLIGSETIEIELNETYIDQGATANDNTDGDITANITTNNPTDTTTAGTYTITYNVTDTAENPAIEVTRTVIVEEAHVVEDTATTTEEMI